MSEKDAAAGLVEFVRACPSMFHTAAEICRRLDAAGFTRLREADAWEMVPGGSYYVVRNNSSVVALKVGDELGALSRRAPHHFQMAAAHGDSPTYKVKAVPVLEGPEG